MNGRGLCVLVFRRLFFERGGSLIDTTVTLVVAAMIFVLLLCITHWTLYTDGEVEEGFFKLLTAIPLFFSVGALFRPRLTVLCLLLYGGSLAYLQLPKIRNLVALQDEAVSIVHFALEQKRKTGAYPTSLNDYPYLHGWTKSHIQLNTDNAAAKFQLTYFTQAPSVSYWYHSDSGFGYYPD